AIAHAAVGLGLGHTAGLLAHDVGARFFEQGFVLPGSAGERHEAHAGVVVAEAVFLAVDAAIGLREAAQVGVGFLQKVGFVIAAGGLWSIVDYGERAEAGMRDDGATVATCRLLLH